MGCNGNNTVLIDTERYGGEGCRYLEEEFRDCLLNSDLIDHPYMGSLFTWTNKREEHGFIARELDRLLVNTVRFSTFPQDSVQFLLLYDHSAILLSYYPYSKNFIGAKAI